MKNVLLKCFRWQWLVCMAVGCCFSSCKDDDGSSVSAYDPNKPIELTDFYPTEGKLSDRIILNGSNFGNKKENVKVFFNEKEAPVISVTENRILVMAPRRASTLEDPACTIKVQIQDKMQQYDQIFNYYIQATVSTLVGGSTNASTNPTGTVSLAEAQFRANIDKVICVDKDRNVYFLVDNNGKHAAYMLNEEADMLKCLKEDINATFDNPFLGYDSEENKVYHFRGNLGSFELAYFDPLSDYGYTQIANYQMKTEQLFNRITGFGLWNARSNFTKGPDGYFYCRMLNGYLMRLDIRTGIGEKIESTYVDSDGNQIEDQVGGDNGTSYGLVFDPNDPNIFYFSVNDQHCIFKYDLTTHTSVPWAGQTKRSGYQDGVKEQALFNKPGQMCFDSEGNMIVTDTENHCIRKITMATGYVSTLAGTPTKSGYTNGTTEEAQFKKPVGICIDADDVMYIGDSENRAIRRLAVE